MQPKKSNLATQMFAKTTGLEFLSQAELEKEIETERENGTLDIFGNKMREYNRRLFFKLNHLWEFPQMRAELRGAWRSIFEAIPNVVLIAKSENYIIAQFEDVEFHIKYTQIFDGKAEIRVVYSDFSMTDFILPCTIASFIKDVVGNMPLQKTDNKAA